MSKMTVRAQLSWAFGSLIVIVLLMAALANVALSDEKSRYEDYVNGINARATAAHLVREAVDLRAIAARNLVLVTRADDLATETAVVKQAHADVITQLKRLNALAQAPGVSPAAVQMIAAIDAIEQRYAPVAMGIVDLALAGQREQAIDRMNKECRPLLAALVKASTDYSDYTREHADQLVAEATEAYKMQRLRLVLASLLALTAALVAAGLIRRSLMRSLGAEPHLLSAAVGRVAEGDLTASLAVRAGDNSSVLAGVARMQESLVRVVSQVRQSSDDVSLASAEIAQGNTDLSSRTESQASALEETAASMEELSSTVQHNANNAEQANQLARQASSVAQRGGQLVVNVVDTMKDIDASSQRIADIIGVIDGIAFQTNILALNAAVEAARAGEQGRGFAVVAAEVRSLAGRSAGAAKEIKSLITANVERVGQGSALVNETGGTMREIVSSIQQLTDTVSEISRATREQSAGLEQVGHAVQEMDQTTQQNAALVEQMAAAAASMRNQAQGLVAAVDLFHLPRTAADRQAGSAPAGRARHLPLAGSPGLLAAART